MLDICRNLQINGIEKYYNTYNECTYIYDVRFSNVTSIFDNYVIIAIECSDKTKYKIKLYDFSDYINNLIDLDVHYKYLIQQLQKAKMTLDGHINVIDCDNMSISDIQEIVNKNIVALTKLNAHINEQKILAAINKSC